MISFPLQGQVFEVVKIRIVEDEDNGPFEEFVLRSHCADCGEEYFTRQRHGFRTLPNRRCALHHSPGRKVSPKPLAEPKKGQAAKVFKPGAKSRQSGIYLAKHQGDHLPNLHLVVRAGEKFRSCRDCGNKVRYSLLTTISAMRDRPELD